MPFPSALPEPFEVHPRIVNGPYRSDDALSVAGGSIDENSSTEECISVTGSPGPTEGQAIKTESPGSLPGKGLLKGLDLNITQPSSSRRVRRVATYNLKTLSRKTTGFQNAQKHGQGGMFYHGGRKRHATDARARDAKRRRAVAADTIADSFEQLPESDNGSRVKSESIEEVLPDPQMHRLWEYVSPVLRVGDHDPSVIPDSIQVRKLLILPRRRDIEWKHSKMNFSVKFTKDITSLLVQVTGDEAPSPCSNCKAGRGPYSGCYVISSQTTVGSVLGCANCCYHGRQSFYSLRDAMSRRAAKEDPEPRNGLTLTVASGDDRETRDTLSLEKVGGETWGTSTSASNSNADSVRSRNARRAPHYSEPTSSLIWSAENPEMPTMEAWEKAPGRICSQISGPIENVAFSKSFLVPGHEVQACNEAFFRVETIKSGTSHKFEARDNATCLCSIAAGKLTVHLDGEPPFVIGPHGMFRIKPGTACIVECDTYTDVIVHVTSVKVDEW